MKGIIKDLDLGIDLDPSVMEDILGALDKKDEEEPKKPDEDKKDWLNNYIYFKIYSNNQNIL